MSREKLYEAVPADFDVTRLTYPKDKFDLVSVDSIARWTEHRSVARSGGHVWRDVPCKAVVITLRCKKCGTVKQVMDKPTIGCKQGPCHKKWIDLSGKSFGDLTVLELVRGTGDRHSSSIRWFWKCQCKCGNICYKSEADLIKTKQTQCGACARKYVGSLIKLPDQLSEWHREYRVLKRNARMRNYTCELTFENFMDLCKQPCYYCGSDPIQRPSGLIKNGVDRFDNTQGYTVENSVSCCPECNTIKLDYSYDFLMSHIEKMLKHCQERSTTIPKGSTLKRVEKDSPEKEDIV